MRKYKIITFLVLFTSCQSGQNNNDTEPESKKTYIEIIREQVALNSKNDTTFLNFVLGASEAVTKAHFADLIKEKKIEPTVTKRLTILDSYFDIKGNPYNLQINDSTSCESILTNTYFGSKLYTLSVFVFGDCKIETLKQFLTNIYGEPTFIEEKKEDYSSKIYYYWITGNKQVTLTDVSFFTSIEFTDLRLKLKDHEFLKTIDSLKKEINKDNAKETKSDFK